MRVMTFSRTFPKYHPKAGQPTHFVEKIWNSFNVQAYGETFYMSYEHEMAFEWNKGLPHGAVDEFLKSIKLRKDIGAKGHTIRAGHRWKVGDFFSPRVWSGVPYRSPQVVFGPDIMVEKTWDFRLREDGEMILDNHEFGMFISTSPNVDEIAKNDGLSAADLVHWFALKEGKSFDGQILSWSKNIEYPFPQTKHL